MRGKVIYRRGSEGSTPHYFIDAVEVTQAEYDERFPSKLEEGTPFVSTAWHDGIASQSRGVHPSQVDEANARNRAHGISTRYDKMGMAHIPNRADRNKLLRLEGAHDNDGGYSDR